MLAISSVMSFTLGLVLVERPMTAKEGIVVPIEQLRIVKEFHGFRPAATTRRRLRCTNGDRDGSVPC